MNKRFEKDRRELFRIAFRELLAANLRADGEAELEHFELARSADEWAVAGAVQLSLRPSEYIACDCGAACLDDELQKCSQCGRRTCDYCGIDGTACKQCNKTLVN